ncbi:MAG TPA: DUF2442 domain-containing protein [Gemmatimonadales bacterium]|nr:DUF2442 domain-containing protein [Gemmatimonadales bacterium]
MTRDHVPLGGKDGASGIVNVGEALRPLRNLSLALGDPAYFAQVRVYHDAGSVTWPNGFDLDPDVLYARAHGIAVI